MATSVKEGWGRMIQEAAIYHTISVVYNFPGLREVVEDKKTGYVVNENPESIANVVIMLLKDDQTRLSFGQAAYQKTKQLTWELTISIWEEAIKQVLTKKEIPFSRNFGDYSD